MADFKLMDSLSKSCTDVIHQAEDLLDFNECANAEIEEIVWCLKAYSIKYQEALKRALDKRSKAQK